MSFLFSNRAKSQLTKAITSNDTTLTIMSGDGSLFPAISTTGGAFPVTLVSSNNSEQSEIVYCISRNGDTFTVIRAQENTLPLPFQSGDIVSLNMTAALYRRFPQAGWLGKFSQEIAQSPGGYQKGALVCDSTPGVYWTSLQDGNITPPDNTNQNWMRIDLNKIVHSTDIAGLVSGTGPSPGDINATQLFVGDQGQNLTVTDETGGTWRIQKQGDYATNTALAAEKNRAIQAENGLLPLAGGILTGTVSRSGGGVLPEVLGATGRTVIQAFTAVADNGTAVSFPRAFGGIPMCIIVNALEADWDVGAAAGTWTTTGFRMSNYSTNTAGRPQRISVMAIGPG